MNIGHLQHESLKTIIRYMDANKRFELSARCPSIQKTERIVPLHIEKLKFNTNANEVSVNSTLYQIGIFRDYPPGVQIPKPHKEDNENGGFPIDLDKFGFEDFTSDSHITPGDVVIKGLQRGVEQHTDQMLEATERSIQMMEAILARKRNGEMVTDLVWRHASPTLDYLEFFVPANQKSVDELQNDIDIRRAFLLPYYSRRNDTRAVFSTSVQLSILPEDDLESIQRYPGTKIYQVQKRLNEFMFGYRKNVSVRMLDVNSDCSILRLPLGTNLKIGELRVKSNAFNIIKAISSIVHPGSLPLSCVTLCRLDRNVYQHDLVKSSKKLVVKKAESIGNLLRRANSQIVEIRSADFTCQEYVCLALRCTRANYPVGTCFSFRIKQKSMIENAMENIRKELNGETIGEE